MNLIRKLGLFNKPPGSDIRLIIGLGNPGRDYSCTRHNIGFIALDYISRQFAVELNRRECLSLTGTGQLKSRLVVMAKPRTYMNLSGDAAARLAGKYRIRPESIIVIHDDLDLKPGQIRLRQGGSSAGHRGIESVINRLGTRDFIRLKIGIGRPDKKASEQDIVDYVLGRFSSEDSSLVENTLPRAVQALESLFEEGIDIAMSRFNRLFTPPETK